MNWNDYYNAWAVVYRESSEEADEEADEIINVARKRLEKLTTEDLVWLAEGLKSHPRKLFVAILFDRRLIPENLFEPFLRTGVMEKNPSFNRIYIEPCVNLRGAQTVLELLLGYLENGTNEEKTGAVDAAYWVRGEISPELIERIRTKLLREFVANEDTDVRCHIVPCLELDPRLYREDVRLQIEQAIAIARAHPNEYIRHRIEVQLGSGGPYMAIPG